MDDLARFADLGDLADASIANDNTLDAVVSALVAWMAATGRTNGTEDEELKQRASAEGWIHLPRP